MTKKQHQFRFNPKLIKALDKHAKSRNMSRNALVEEILGAYLLDNPQTVQKIACSSLKDVEDKIMSNMFKWSSENKHFVVVGTDILVYRR